MAAADRRLGSRGGWRAGLEGGEGLDSRLEQQKAGWAGIGQAKSATSQGLDFCAAPLQISPLLKTVWRLKSFKRGSKNWDRKVVGEKKN